MSAAVVNNVGEKSSEKKHIEEEELKDLENGDIDGPAPENSKKKKNKKKKKKAGMFILSFWNT